MAIAVWDPKSKKTALAHLDDKIRGDSLSTLFSRMPTAGLRDGDLKVRLVGARYCFNPDPDLSKYGRTTLARVLKFLVNKPVDIVSADLYEDDQVGAVVFDPKDFSVYEAVAAAPNPNKALFRLHMTLRESPFLRIAFDFTQSKQRRPILFDPVMVRALKETAFNGNYIYEFFEGDHARSGNPMVLAFTSTCFSPVRAGYEEMCGRMEEHLKAQNAPDRLLRSVRHRALYLGEGAEEANKRLLNNRWANMRKRQMIPA